MTMTEPHIKNLYPELDPQQLKAAEENLEAYLALVLRIYIRLEREDLPLGSLPTLTEANLPPTMQAKVEI
jgi:hypothetical protein